VSGVCKCLNGQDINTTSNCGACGNKCATSQACVSGVCKCASEIQCY
jgi:hypothetical protein